MTERVITRSSEKKLEEITVTFQPIALINPVMNRAPVTLIIIGNKTQRILRKINVRITDIAKTTDNYDIHISAKKNKKIQDLKNMIYKNLVGAFTPGEILLTSKRQLAAVCGASKHLKQAYALLKENNSLELVVEDLNLCISELDKITIKTTRDDILDSVFSSFCVGK